MIRQAFQSAQRGGGLGYHLRRLYASQAKGEQTPVQSQDEAEIISARAPTAVSRPGNVVQTPIQSQSRSAIEQQARKATILRPSDAGLRYTFLSLLIATPIVCYYYYEHRKRHMHDKKQRLLKEAQDRYQAAAKN